MSSKASQIRQKAQEFLSKGHVDKAIQEYRRLISIESKNPNLYNELGDIYLRASDKAQAVQNFEKASVIYEKVALYNNAVAVCKKILRVNPEKIDTILKLAELRAKQKLDGEAGSFFAQYAEGVLANPQSLLQGAAKDVERMVGLLPQNTMVLEKAVEIYEQLGLKLKIAGLCGQIVSLAEQKQDSKKQVHYRRKLEELKSNCTSDELKALDAISAEKGAAAEPGSESAGEAVSVSGEAAPVAGVAEEASDAGEHTIPDSPAGAEPGALGSGAEVPAAESSEYGLDANAAEEGEEAEMVAAMSHGHETFTGASGAEARGERNDVPRGAAQTAPPAQAAAPESDAPAAGAPRAAAPSAANGAREDGEAPEGRDRLVEEITSDVEKDDLKSHYDLGMAYLEMGLYNEAIKDFQIASRCEGLQLSSMEMIGYCFIKHNQPRLAVKQLMRALEMAQSSPAGNLGIHYNLGLAHEMLGELDAAREHFEEVYIADMSFRDVSTKMKKLSTVS